jgi:hypothetical protein
MPGPAPFACHVVPRRGGWAVSSEGRLDRHPTLTSATRAAVRAAAIAAAHGRPAHVLSRRSSGGWMLVWDSADDFPPAAQFGTSNHIAPLSSAEAD